MEPIKNKGRIGDIANYLYKMDRRGYILFMIGIKTGIKMDLILDLKIKDVNNKWIINAPGNKIRIDAKLRSHIKEFCIGKEKFEYLFKSKIGFNKPISIERAYDILSEVGGMYGIEEFGTITLRKTFAYHHYKDNGDLKELMKILGHPNDNETLRYIGKETR